MVEVQYLPDLLVNNAFDLVYHEHRNFFSLSSLEAAAARHGLYVRKAELTDRQGGSLRATLARHPQTVGHVDKLRASETWLNSYGAYEGMQGRAERIRVRLLQMLAEQNGTTAIYGAPAKATTLLNFCGLTAAELPWCVDTTEAKQGRHIPGTGIPIQPPGMQPPDTYLLTAWNYAGTIIRANAGPQWIVPFPAPAAML
jgi:novobiocin biosynthesis protein NovU/D-mycarose 3-C-methyltransferase